MDDYRISREMYAEHLMGLAWGDKIETAFKNIAPAVKSAFTRLYNTQHKAVKAEKGGKAGPKTSTEEEESDEEEYALLDEEQIKEIKRAKEQER